MPTCVFIRLCNVSMVFGVFCIIHVIFGDFGYNCFELFVCVNLLSYNISHLIDVAQSAQWGLIVDIVTGSFSIKSVHNRSAKIAISQNENQKHRSSRPSLSQNHRSPVLLFSDSAQQTVARLVSGLCLVVVNRSV